MHNTNKKVLKNAEYAIRTSISGMIDRGVQTSRIARSAFITGCINDEIIREILRKQKHDGGWDDVEETVWAESALKKAGADLSENINRAKRWIATQRSASGGWGKTKREMSRITTTALTLTLEPRIGIDDDFAWIEDAWHKDYISNIKLTYKGALTLMALGSANRKPCNSELVLETIQYLQIEQNDDGGFGPWKNHPIGSDPWSTGICLVGLCSYPNLVDRSVVERAADWLCKTQLASGFWAYHFIDEGSAYAYWGLKGAIKLLGGA